MGKYFGTDGFRGEAGVSLTAHSAYKIGRYLGYAHSNAERRARIVVGKDTRRSSYMLEYALAAGVCASGGDVYLMHVTTTPSVSYAVRTEGFDVGVMISASHNPYYDNGIKLMRSDGEKMDEQECLKIEQYLDSPDELPLATRDKIGRTVDYVLARNRYTGYLISLSKHSYKGLRVGIDGANGAAWSLARSIFDTLGAKTCVIGDTPNGTNINLKSGSTDMKALCELVVREGLDIGFAFDGDADRCLAVNERGEIMRGEHILYFMSKYLRAQGEPGCEQIVTTVMSNLALTAALKKEGIGVRVCGVGDRFVYEAMDTCGAALGGEESGHIIFKKHGTTGDGLITAIKIMEALIESKGRASELSRGLKLYPQLMRNVKVVDKARTMADKRLLSAVALQEKALHGEGRVLVRASGTEPLVRIMVESQDEGVCASVADALEDIVRLTQTE